jgi:hypothetical protein
MIKQTLILAILPVAVGAHATCLTDPPEMGDIGPSSELVCNGLQHRFPGAALVVEGRSIRSPTEVAVVASVDGKRVSLHYELAGYAWQLAETGSRIADVSAAPADQSIGK